MPQKSFAPKTLREQLVRFIKSSFKKEGCTEALVAVSGGVDSATTLMLTVLALGSNHVYPVLLPYGSLNGEGTRDALMLIGLLSIPRRHVITIDIQPAVDAVAAWDKTIDHARLG